MTRKSKTQKPTLENGEIRKAKKRIKKAIAILTKEMGKDWAHDPEIKDPEADFRKWKEDQKG